MTDCTCPCIDCIEGNHCGGFFFDTDDEGENELIGTCNDLDAVLEGMKELFFEDDWSDEEYDYDDEEDE